MAQRASHPQLVDSCGRSDVRRPDIDASSMSTQVVRMLRDADMPIDEIRAIATADGPAVAHRYIELHAERLSNSLANNSTSSAPLSVCSCGPFTAPTFRSFVLRCRAVLRGGPPICTENVLMGLYPQVRRPPRSRDLPRWPVSRLGYPQFSVGDSWRTTEMSLAGTPPASRFRTIAS
jgi:hypothetical protein